MRNLILISKTPIIIQIFNLVCKKIDVQLTVIKELQVDHKVDIIIVDKELIDDRFNIIKTYAKRIGAISKNELPFNMANDFLVPLPFLPSTLQTILEEQIELVQKKEKSKTYISNIDIPDETFSYDDVVSNDTNELDPAVEYLENLADGIIENINTIFAGYSQDEIKKIVGGILDTNELSKIEDIIEPESTSNLEKEFTKESEDDEWLDLASIIDHAINEVNTTNELYNKFDNKPIKVLLNNYSLTELTPLLNMLDQDIINTLTEGYEVTVQLKLESKNG